MLTVLAVGGHTLSAGAGGELADALAALAGDRVVVTHGNGPQVGAELERDPATSVHVAVARTQGELGSQLAVLVGAVTVVTHVLVDPADPAFGRPTKPIGPFYDEEEARRLAREHGWQVADETGRGWRRVVASPAPLQVVELPSIRALVTAGETPIACGGGGVPVAQDGDRVEGVDAVIDKDRASALLATALGAGRLVILTDVDAVYRDFRGPGERALPRLTPAEAEALLAELPAGSMRPKVQAAAAFAHTTGGETLITSPAALRDALAGGAGTRVAP